MKCPCWLKLYSLTTVFILLNVFSHSEAAILTLFPNCKVELHELSNKKGANAFIEQVSTTIENLKLTGSRHQDHETFAESLNSIISQINRIKNSLEKERDGLQSRSSLIPVKKELKSINKVLDYLDDVANINADTITLIKKSKYIFDANLIYGLARNELSESSSTFYTRYLVGYAGNPEDGLTSFTDLENRLF